ncbi:MAG TPA: Mpo1-like protein [Burkholderiales bacterium]|jgi:uncharacterized membrane protein YGL010W|nr:Mpo1-like protein [Burkholderiales bacterium]
MRTLEQQMSFYLRYHRNPWNRLTHFIGVPVIIFSLFIPLGWLRLPVDGFDVTGAQLFALVVMLYYFVLDATLAVTLAAFIALMLYGADQVSQLSWKIGAFWFVATFACGWIMQLIGHVFEGRKPALTDNFFQIFIAPIFLMAEVFFALGLKKDVLKRTEDLAG